MNEIVGSVQRVSDIIGEITAASAEQSQGIGQVNSAVTHLDQMTQQNSALVEQSAAAAEGLREQANRLTTVVGAFKLGSDQGVSTAQARPPAKPAPQATRAPATKPRAAPAPAKPVARATASPQPAPRPVAMPKPAAPTPSPAAAGDEWETF